MCKNQPHQQIKKLDLALSLKESKESYIKKLDEAGLSGVLRENLILMADLQRKEILKIQTLANRFIDSVEEDNAN